MDDKIKGLSSIGADTNNDMVNDFYCCFYHFFSVPLLLMVAR